jgi:hypothetical protein
MQALQQNVLRIDPDDRRLTFCGRLGEAAMSWEQSARKRLPEHLDAHGDLAPPWEQFPNYERYTIGWRMGDGEDWLGLWHVFVEGLAPAFAVRLAYLKRHPPAPVSWADRVHRVLRPSAREERGEAGEQIEAQRRAELLAMGLIASDAAYPIWLNQQKGVRWPWESGEAPESYARYWTRDFWFWSRQVAALRSEGWKPRRVPGNWQPCAAALESGRVPALDLHRGLLSLAQMLAAGRVVPPWELGLRTEDFADSFEMDMGYADAFRLWVMSAFDDCAHLGRCLGPAVPGEWEEWVEEQFHFD